MRGKTVEISQECNQLLEYIIKYRRLRAPSNKKATLEQLILTYAKQLVAGIPEAKWRANMLALINQIDSKGKE